MAKVSLAALKNLKNAHRKDFRHCFLPDKGAYNEDTPAGRFYVTPEGNRYRSVTGFLSTMKGDSDWLERWKEKLGSEEAVEAESRRVKDRGTGVHLALEHLLLNKPDPFLAGDYVKMYNQIATHMCVHVDDIYALELALYSDIMRLGGRVDCIAKWKGELSIIDFKTSTKMKRADWITDYFLQGTTYSLMLQEMYGLKAEQIVIIVSLEGEDKPQIFTRRRSDYTALLAQKVKEFHRLQEEEAKKSSVLDFFS